MDMVADSIPCLFTVSVFYWGSLFFISPLRISSRYSTTSWYSFNYLVLFHSHIISYLHGAGIYAEPYENKSNVNLCRFV